MDDLEGVHLNAMWEEGDSGNYERAALHALRAAYFVGVRTTEGAGVLTAQAQVFATLYLAQATEERNRG